MNTKHYIVITIVSILGVFIFNTIFANPKAIQTDIYTIEDYYHAKSFMDSDNKIKAIHKNGLSPEEIELIEFLIPLYKAAYMSMSKNDFNLIQVKENILLDKTNIDNNLINFDTQTVKNPNLKVVKEKLRYVFESKLIDNYTSVIVQNYKKDNKIKKLEVSFMGSTFLMTSNYYFKNENLIYLNRIISKNDINLAIMNNKPIPSKNTVVKKYEYFFKDDSLIDIEINDNILQDNKEMYDNKNKELLLNELIIDLDTNFYLKLFTKE